MMGQQLRAACLTCNAEVIIPSPGPGRHVAICAACQTQGVVEVPFVTDASTHVEIRRPIQLKKVVQFDAIYNKLEPVSTHVLEERWALLGIYVGLIGFAEIVVAQMSALAGLLVHVAVLGVLLLHSGLLSNRSEPAAHVAMALSLVPLVRIVSLTTPLGGFGYVQWFVVMGAVLGAGMYAFIRTLKPRPEEIRFVMPTPRQLPLELGVALMGIPIGMAEYALIRPGPLLEASSFAALVGPALLLIAGMGLMEEAIWRGILPAYLGRVYGGAATVFVPAAAQAAFAIAYLDGAFVGFIFAVGLVYGLVARRTGSVLGVGLSHGIAAALFFLVLPLTGLPNL